MMTPAQLTALQGTRDRLVAALLELQTEPPLADDGTKKAKRVIKDRAYEVAGLEKMIEQHGELLARANPPPVTEPGSSEIVPWVQQGSTIASIPKGKRAELRVSVNEWKGLQTIDLRIWFQPKGGGDWGPSRKGVSFEAGKVDALLAALALAKQHLQPERAAGGGRQ